MSEDNNMAEHNQMLFVESDLQKKIVDLLGSKGPMTRGDICQQLGYTTKIPIMKTLGGTRGAQKKQVGEQLACRTTVYDQLAKLMNRHVVCNYPVQSGKRGRPKVYFVIEFGG